VGLLATKLTILLRLQEWFARQCDGNWEHNEGVSIESCDNPGWWVKIGLKGTRLENVAFEPLSENVDHRGHPAGPRWIDCRVLDGQWSGSGDETKLERILEIFLSWAEHHRS
jgi:hypothetical protein